METREFYIENPEEGDGISIRYISGDIEITMDTYIEQIYPLFVGQLGVSRERSELAELIFEDDLVKSGKLTTSDKANLIYIKNIHNQAIYADSDSKIIETD